MDLREAPYALFILPDYIRLPRYGHLSGVLQGYGPSRERMVRGMDYQIKAVGDVITENKSPKHVDVSRLANYTPFLKDNRGKP